MAKVLSVNISVEKGTVKEPVEQIGLIANYGIQGDAHAGNWHRQVSLLADESIDEMRALGIENLHYGIFAENITTCDIELHTLPVGTILAVGTGILEVTQIGKECHYGCEIFKKVGKCVMPQRGIFARVLKSGTVRAGDEILVLDGYNEND